MINKKELAITLSKVKGFEVPKLKFEQYQTDSEIAAEGLWQAFLIGDIKEAKIADLGAGTGILGIGALLLGADEVIFVECDPDAVKILLENLEILAKNHNLTLKVRVQLTMDIEDSEIMANKADNDLICKSYSIKGKNHKNTVKSHNSIQKVRVYYGDVIEFQGENYNLVLQNPPFGTKVRGADIKFLEKSIQIAPIIYSFHKTSTIDHIIAKITKKGAKVSHRWDYEFPLKATMRHHKKKMKHIEVSLLRITASGMQRA